jgi:hypothetical protein
MTQPRCLWQFWFPEFLIVLSSFDGRSGPLSGAISTDDCQEEELPASESAWRKNAANIPLTVLAVPVRFSCLASLAVHFHFPLTIVAKNSFRIAAA